jgi:autotransporter-associated beta strand protein
MKLRLLMALALGFAVEASNTLATDLHFDYVPQASAGTPGVDPHFGLAQLAALNYPSINGNYMMVTGTLTASQIAQAGNTSVIWYDSFNKNEFPTYDAAAEAAKIDTYAKSKNGNVRPGWVVLNELSSLMRDTTSTGDSYRQWTTDLMSLLHNNYNYNIVLLNQKGTLSASLDGPYKSTWQSLASNAYIGIEEYLAGPSIINSGSNYASRLSFAKSAYQSSKDSYINVGGISADRLVLTEHFGNTSSDPSVYYGRHGLASASDWDAAIQVRQDAIYSVGFAGFMAYSWGGNAMGLTEAEQIQHELYYRTRLVIPGQQPQWLPDAAYTVGDAATPVPLSWSQPLNWLGSGVVSGVPNSVPNSAGAVANFYRTNTAARTITLDGDKTIGTLTFNSPNSFTISPGSGGSILLNNSGSAAILTVSQGSHSIAVPMQFQSSVTMTANAAAGLNVSGAISGVGALTKTGVGALLLSGANSYAGGTTINAGTLLVANSSGSGTGSGAVAVNSGGTLAGNGTISGAVTIDNGGRIAPGPSIDSLDVGSLSLGAGSILDVELNTSQGADSSDLINVTTTGGLAINGGTLNLINAGSMTGGFYRLIDYSGNFSGSVNNITLGNVPAGFTYRLFNDAASESIDLEVTAPGDFNHDGKVDAADYVLWRSGFGTIYTQTDYDAWRAHFGQVSSGSNVSENSSVPEPGIWVLLFAATIAACFYRSRGIDELDCLGTFVCRVRGIDRDLREDWHYGN